MDKFYAVGCIAKKHDLDWLGRTVSLPLTWADGMIGVIPVFKTKAAARKYGGKKLGIYEFSAKAMEGE